MGTPGPNPGGPGLTPYTGGGYATQPTASAALPMLHPMHPVAHTRAMRAYHKASKFAGTTAAQLNREELARLHAGNSSASPPLPGTMPPPH